ncbi:unnamed protein product [Brachionus calyciflorus]|uniref:Uncharacterized protein n=1 Tax=Brachionus calyciflorus TaxID=104777 RepID=A0A814MHQ7_9BILA|nr:unnamed protein product [Brachionus calyciflorus]
MNKNFMMTDSLMTEDKSDDAVDENQNYFCKHYKPSKKEDLNVRFNTKQNQVKFITVESDTMDTMQVQRNKIESFETYDQINEQIDILLLKLEELSKRKIEQGYDVSYDFDLVKFQVNVLKRQKEKIEHKEQEIGKHKKQIEAENKLKQDKDKRYEMENETKKIEREYLLKIELDNKARKEQDHEKKILKIKIEKVNDEDDNKFGVENEKVKVIHVNIKKNVKELNVKEGKKSFSI